VKSFLYAFIAGRYLRLAEQYEKTDEGLLGHNRTKWEHAMEKARLLLDKAEALIK
jgi:hypothetical protein